jgi:MFS family permease
MIQIGALVQVLALIFLPFCTKLAHLIAVNSILGLAWGISLPATQAIITAEGRKTGLMGTIMSTLFLAQSLGMLLGPLLAGALFSLVDFRTIFYVGSGLVLSSLVPIFIYLRPTRSTSYGGQTKR